MAYVKNTWARGDKISSTKMNHLEQGVADAQEKLVSGTNIKTVNNQSLLGSGNITIQGGSGEPEIFWAEYGITTYADIMAAAMAGMNVLCYNEDNTGHYLYQATAFVDNQVFFTAVSPASAEWVSVTSANVWSYGSTPIGGGVSSLNGQTGALNLKTVGGTSLLGTGDIPIGGGGGGAELFIATYNVTTFAQVQAAWQAGKIIRVKMTYADAPTEDFLCEASTNYFRFTKYVDDLGSGMDIGMHEIMVTSDNTWTQGAVALAQRALVSGTNIKTINNQSLLGSGNITIQGGAGEPEVFWAEYGVTTYADIMEAISAGMNVLCYYRDSTGTYIYQSAGSTSDTIYFFLIVQNGIANASVTSANVWNQTYTALQEALTSGTNIKTVGGQSLLGAGDIPVQAIFPVNLTETTQMHFTADKTFAECLAAFNAGKRPVFVVYSDTVGVVLADVTNYVNGFLLSSILIETGYSAPTHFIFSIAYSADYGLFVSQSGITAASV